MLIRLGYMEFIECFKIKLICRGWKRYQLLGLCLGIIIMLAPVTELYSQGGSKPNVIIIYGDDVGYGDIGAYGAKKIPTPNIDRLANEGLLFTQAYATAATCTPSRYSLLTGKYAFRNERARVLSGEAPLLIEPGSDTLPQLLQEEGYRTSVVGKWHLGLGDGDVNWNDKIKPGPLEVGFQESFIIPATNDRVPTVYVKNHRVYGLKDEDKPLRVSYKNKIGDLPTGKSHPELLRYPADPQHSGTIVNEISRIGWMEGGQSAWWTDQEMPFIFARRSQDFIRENSDRPFFLFLSLHETHVPRAPNRQFVGKSQTSLRGDAIVELDWVVGQVLSTLEERDLREKTLIVFSSDNGPIYDDGYTDGAITDANGHKANGNLRGGKYLAYEGGTRVPFIVSWPGEVQEDTQSDALFSQVDLLASLMQLTGNERPEKAGPDSQNLLHTLLGKKKRGREFVVQQSPGGLSIRKGKWKLIPAETNPPKWADAKHNGRENPISTPMWSSGNVLYNLEEDPDESNNVAAQHPSVVKELSKKLNAIRLQNEGQ